ncbi:GAF domain-containing protein [Streptomyces griseoaurantiacus]|uniref:GAF domain-containing protein n=1 Tax=Streptomyces griseoaurantiacus TaxID=68213 RepID=UPI0037958ED7
MQTLLDAVVAIGSDLELEDLLRRIVQSAVDLVDAEYGALGVLGEEGTIRQFITVGMDRETIERIGHYPEGHGILGLLIREPHPLRLEDLGTHADSVGFPAGHPPMRTFLGAPYRSGTRCSETCISPTSAADCPSTPTTRRCCAAWRRPRAWRSTTPVCTRAAATANGVSRRVRT